MHDCKHGWSDHEFEAMKASNNRRQTKISVVSSKQDNRKELDRLSKEVNDSNGIALATKPSWPL